MRAALIYENGDVDCIHPLDQTTDAMARMEASDQFGKIILHMPH